MIPLLKRNKYLVIAAIALLCLVRAWFAVVPFGASPIPFLVAKVDGGTIQSPNGHRYQVWFNDAGAMHSGPHWTWVVSGSLLFGKHVVTEGYLGPEHAVDKKPIAVNWGSGKPVIQFLDSR